MVGRIVFNTEFHVHVTLLDTKYASFESFSFRKGFLKYFTGAWFVGFIIIAKKIYVFPIMDICELMTLRCNLF